MKFIYIILSMTILMISSNATAKELAYCSDGPTGGYTSCYKIKEGTGSEEISVKTLGDMYAKGWHLVTAVVGNYQIRSGYQYAKIIYFYFEK